MPTSCRLKICVERSLSRAELIAYDELSENTPICSNWRTTAVPNALIEAPMRGITAS